MNTAIRNATPEDRLRDNAGDPARASWSGVETMLATLIDEVRQLEWLYVSAHTEKPVTKPEPIKRPGITSDRRRRRAMNLDAARKLDPRLRGLADDEAREKLRRLTGGA